MPTFSGGYVEPGVYVKIEDAVLPALPPGTLVAAIIGTGKTTKDVTNEEVTFSLETPSLWASGVLAGVYTTAPTPPNTLPAVGSIIVDSETITDSTGVITYVRDTDYQVAYSGTDNGKVFWLWQPSTLPYSIKVSYTGNVVNEDPGAPAGGGGNEYTLVHGGGTYEVGILPSPVTVKNKATPTTIYVEGTDYTVTHTPGAAGKIIWIGTPPVSNVLVDYQYRIAAEVASVAAVATPVYRGILAATTTLQHLEYDSQGRQIFRDKAGEIYVIGTDPDEYTLSIPTKTIKANTIPSITSDKMFIVSYTVLKDTTLDYDPRLFSSQQSVVTWYGTAGVDNTVSLGSQIYFENGGGLVVGVQVTADTYAGYTAAIDKLENIDVYCVVPLLETDGATTNPALISKLKQHVEQMSTTIEKKERVGLLAGPTGMDSKSDLEGSADKYVTAANSADSSRIAFIAPAGSKKTITSGQITLTGPFIACALAGIICNPAYTSGEPISGKALTGFDSVEDIYTRRLKNIMASEGVMVMEQVGARIAVRHALSTDVSTIVTSEFKITRIKDYIAKLMRNSLESIFINTRNVGAITLDSIKGVCTLLLDGVISLRDIVAYQNLTVVQSSIDPRQINVSFQIRPSWDVNWILVTFGVTVS